MAPLFVSADAGCLASLEETRCTHTTTDTHADKAVLLLATLEFANNVAGQA